MPTRDFDWWQDACRRVRFLSHQDVLDDPQLDDIPDDVPLTVSQPRDMLTLLADVPYTRRRGRELRLDIQRHVRADEGEVQLDPPEGFTHVDQGVADDIPLGDNIPTRAEHHFAASFGPIVRYKIARDTPQVQPRHPLPPCNTTDMSWIPPLTPPFAILRVRGSAPLRHQFGTPPSWEYPQIQSGSGSSPMMPGSHHPSHPSTSPVIHPVPQRPHRQRQPPPCGTSSHLQHHP
ncbi:hypothetical protein PIB30_080884 [Stylosanthes scabra]|uniref:Uncharacterized protein n=1 Tax=Stylosanthes scabra TaxID=79078 RepID=A0ABU6ZQ68_9FABA|nr:hypothetical protein [Stylosanthes scabra]